jgi:hypothetical protein
MTTYPVQGIDLSRWQPTDPVETGLSFVIARACIGTVPDPMYGTHVAYAAAHGLVPLAYDFGVDGLTGADQAARMLAVVGHTTEAVVLDIEGANAPSPQQARDWIAAMRAAGKVPGVYHSLSGYPGELGQAFRWVAAWGTTPPPIPWDFWQSSDAGRFPGYLGPIDTDAYHGTLAQLRALVKLPPLTQPVRWELLLSPHAVVQEAVLSPSGCIDHWIGHPWGPAASSAPCTQPHNVDQCGPKGTANVTRVLAGVFAGKLVHAGSPGVTTTHS